MRDWRAFFLQHQVALESHYPGLTLERFLREASEIGGDGTSFLTGTPFAYQLGYAEFYCLKFKVNSSVLIPRAETELLTEKAIAWIQQQKRALKVVDLCTGSGCIGLTIAHEVPETEVWLADVSVEALLVAGENADAIAPRANVVQSDLLEDVLGKFDLIVCNPPYIPLSERGRSVHPQVDQYEPAIALYVHDEDYENFFRRLFAQLRIRLKSGGLFLMEGQPEKLSDCAQWAREQGFKFVQTEKDWAQRVRFLRFEAP